jgi:hypothetical protein
MTITKSGFKITIQENLPRNIRILQLKGDKWKKPNDLLESEMKTVVKCQKYTDKW